MKRKLLKSLLTIACLLCSIGVYAYDFEVDGIYYQIIADNEVAVTYYGEDINNIPDEYKYAGTVVIPESVTYEGVTYSVTSIGDAAFSGCSGLTSVTIPNSVTSIGYYPFINCDGLISIKVEEGNTVYDSREGCNAIIEAATNTLVAGCKNTVIPNSVTSIGVCAFENCSGLTSITIPNSVTSIGDFAFYNCTGLTEITIPSSVTSIGDYAFSGCSGLTSIRIEAVNPPAIKESTFNGIDKTTPVYVPTQECVEAYRNAEYWSEFTNIKVYIGLVVGNKFTVDGIHYEVLKESGQVAVTYYGEDIYDIPDEYKYAGTVVIPESVTYEGVTYSVSSIGFCAFYECSGLTSVTIPNSVTSIGYGAFQDCTGLTEITIPNSVTSIGAWAFSGCSGLISIKVEDGNTVYDSREGCNAIIEAATNTLVAGCKNTVIPNSVTSIGEGTFYNCTGLTSVTIPNSVTSIGGGAFANCTGLTSIRIEAVNPPAIEEYTFEGVDKSIPVYVPTESLEAYQNAAGWSEFANIVAVGEDDNSLHAEAIEVAKVDGILTQDEISLPISLINTNEIAGLQCDIFLPDGLTPVMQGDKYDVVLSSRAEGFDVTAKLRNDGALRVVVVSTDTTDSIRAISGNEGELFTIKLKPNEQYSTDDNIAIRNIVMTGSDYTEYEVSEVIIPCTVKESFLGDVNRDGKVNVTDVIVTIGKVLNVYDGEFDTVAADIDQDGEITIVDVVGIINLVLDEGDTPSQARMQDEYAQGELTLQDVKMSRGETKDLVIGLTNEAPYTAFQMDVTLPAGLNIEHIALSERANGHTLQWQAQADGSVRIVGYALDNATIADNDGALLTLTVSSDSQFETGKVMVSNTIFSTRQLVSHRLERMTAKVSNITALNDVVAATRIYATDHKVVVDSPVAQEAAISTIDGVVQRVALQPGRNEIPLHQGVYIVAVDAEVKKVVIR